METFSSCTTRHSSASFCWSYVIPAVSKSNKVGNHCAALLVHRVVAGPHRAQGRCYFFCYLSPALDTLSLSALTVRKHNAVLPFGGQSGGYVLPFTSCGMWSILCFCVGIPCSWLSNSVPAQRWQCVPLSPPGLLVSPTCSASDMKCFSLESTYKTAYQKPDTPAE